MYLSGAEPPQRRRFTLAHELGHWICQSLSGAAPSVYCRAEEIGHDAALTQLAELVSPRILNAPGLLDAVARQLDEYFSRRRRAFDVPVDLRLSRGFRHSVLTHLRQIPYGATESYAQVAAATGHPRAVRAAGSACATNPVPIVVPCHRVVRSDGSPGGYAGGPDAKRSLLTLEAA